MRGRTQFQHLINLFKNDPCIDALEKHLAADSEITQSRTFDHAVYKVSVIGVGNLNISGKRAIKALKLHIECDRPISKEIEYLSPVAMVALVTVKSNQLAAQ